MKTKGENFKKFAVRVKVCAGSEMPRRFLLASTSFESLHFH